MHWQVDQRERGGEEEHAASQRSGGSRAADVRAADQLPLPPLEPGARLLLGYRRWQQAGIGHRLRDEGHFSFPHVGGM